MINNKYFNEMILLAEKKSRKGDGATAILNLMSSTLDFLDKVDDSIESVANPENKRQLETYKGQVENMYTEMAEMSKGAIRQMSNEQEFSSESEEKQDTSSVEKPVSSKPVNMINAPVIPKI